MGKGGLNYPNLSLQEFTWEEVKRHNSKTDRWLVIEDCVYDISRWCKKHPGGERIISNFAGEDATDAWHAFHIDKAYVSKYMQSILVGRIKTRTEEVSTRSMVIEEDFRKLRKLTEEMGLYKPRTSFFVFIMAHILVIDLLGWGVMRAFGTGWLPYITGAVLLTVAQIQAGWAQHDYGHLSVFKQSRWNHWAQIFLLNFIKGASSDWWNYRHYNHHAKPNIIRMDPDIRFVPLFLLGKVLPTEWGKKKRNFLPYNHQHQYFFFILPPLLLPLYFNYEIPYFLITRRLWSEMFWMATFFVRFHLMFGSLLGFWGVMGLFIFVRFMESHWFVWTTQMSHLPMDVDYDHCTDWVTMQLKATCNVEPSLFNDWFSGHLNFQIEHHLFPTMPRHNYHKVAPLVKSMCDKHCLDYQSKPMLKAFKDIVSSLKESGDMWYDAYTK